MPRVISVRALALLGICSQILLGCATASGPNAPASAIPEARAQPLSAPEARQTALAFVEAFNSGDAAAMARFAERYSVQRGPRPPEKEIAARHQQLVNRLGRLRVHSVEVGSETATIHAEAEKDGWVDLTLFFDPRSSSRITGRRLEPAPPPVAAAIPAEAALRSEAASERRPTAAADRPAADRPAADRPAADRPAAARALAGPADRAAVEATRAPATQTLAQRMEGYLAGLASRDLFSGVVLVARGDEVLFQAAHGYADRDTRAANRIDTKFDIASVGKAFTAVAVMQLVQAGKLRLEDTVGQHISDYPNVQARQRTVYGLLTHTSGLGDFFGPRYQAARTRLRTPADFIALAGEDPPAFPQGARWRYSNLGYVVLGRIIEKVSGVGYDEYLRQQLFDPLQMRDTGPFPVDAPVPNRAVHYTHRGADDQWHPEARWPATPYSLPKGSPSGGIYSTAPDLVKFGRGLLENRLLSPQTTRDMLAGKVKIEAGGASGEKYAYGLTESWTRGIRHLGHTGESLGVSAFFELFPESGHVVVVLTNYDGPLGTWVGARAVEWVTEELERGRSPAS